jgi:hypothetical protein
MTNYDWVVRQVNRWKPRLLLDHWSVVVTLEEKDVEAGGGEYVARILPSERYTEAQLWIYPTFFRRSLAYRKMTILHELLHIQTWPINVALHQAAKKGVISEKRQKDLNEGLTEYVTKLLTVAYSHRKKKGLVL